MDGNNVIDPIKFSAACRVVPVVNDIVTEVTIHQRSKTRISALVVSEQLALKTGPPREDITMVIEVTDLDDDGPGSLRVAVKMPAATVPNLATQTAKGVASLSS